MAERWAVADGNWSALATWDGGVSLPGAGDTVHANGFTVTIDQDITVGSLRTTAGTTAVAGGGFGSSGDVTVNADLLAGSSNCFSPASGNIAVNGEVRSSSTTNNIRCIAATNTVNLTVTGNVFSGGSGNTIGLFWGSSGTCIVNGNVEATGGNYGLHKNGTGSVTVNGNVTGSASFSSRGLFCSNSSGSVSIVGDLLGRAGDAVEISAGTLNVTGNVTGGSAGYGIDITASATVVIDGHVTAATVAGIRNVSSGPVTVSGNATAGSGASAIENTSTGIVTVRGDRLCSAQGYAAEGGKILCHASNAQVLTRRVETAGAAGAARNVWSSGSYPGV